MSTLRPAAAVTPSSRGRGRHARGGRRALRPPILGHHAALLVLAAIAVGAIGMAVSWALSRDETLEPAAYIRYSIVITVLVYAVVAALVVTQLAPSVRLRWSQGPPATSVLMGAAAGAALGGLLLAAVSAQAGHLAPDDRVVLTMSEGDVAHIAVAVLLTGVCAPVIEEVLFRGLLLESLRRYHSAVAVAVSGVAFAAWHLNPSALRYYAVLGAILGILYVKRGLACSIAAHAAFNGVLVAAALAVVLGPSTTVAVGDVSLEAPGGWSVETQTDTGLQLSGPSGASLVVLELPTASAPTAATVLGRIRDGLLTQTMPSVVVDTASTRQTHLPAGDAVEVDVSADGHRGTMVLVPLPGRSLDMVFLSGGSMRAQADFDRLVGSVRVG